MCVCVCAYGNAAEVVLEFRIKWKMKQLQTARNFVKQIKIVKMIVIFNFCKVYFKQYNNQKFVIKS